MIFTIELFDASVIGAIFNLLKSFSGPDPSDGTHADVHGAEIGAQKAILKHIEAGLLDVPVLG